MSEFNIIDTDDETIYTEEDIRELCTEEEDLLDVDKIILKREKEGRRKFYEGEVLNDFISDLEIGENILEKYKLAIEKNTPIEFIYKDSNEKLFSIRDRLKGDTNVLENLKFFRKDYSITIGEFTLAYYFSNLYMKDKAIIDNLNKIKKLSGVEYNLEEWPEKKKRFNTVFDNRMEITNKKFDKIKKFYQEISDIPFSTPPEKINDSFKLDRTKVRVKIKKENYYFDIDSGDIIFDELSVNKKFPYVQYNGYIDKFYKIFDKQLDLESLMVARENLFSKLIEEDEEIDNTNKIYIICRLEVLNKINYILLEINLVDSTLTFEYPYNTSYKIYSDLKKLIPGLTFLEENIVSFNGSFEIKLDNYDELNFYYLTLFDPKFSNFIYLNENKRPRSLMKNIKYYYKSYTEDFLESDFSISFYLEKLYIDKYLVSFKSKIEEKDNKINEFALIISKLIYYYENYDFKETDLALITNPYTGPDGDGLGDNLKVEDLSSSKTIIKGNKLTNLITQAPEIFPVNIYGKKCQCPNQPIIIDDSDLKDWSNYLDKDAISVFPPKDSVDKSQKKYIFACPTDDLVFNYIINPDSKSPFPILPCCSQTVKNNYYRDYDLIKKDPENFFNLRADQKVNVSKTILKTLNPLASEQRGNVPLVLKQFLKKFTSDREYYRYGLNKNSKNSFFHCCLYASEHLDKVAEAVKNKRYLRNLKFLIQIREKYLGLDVSERDTLVDKIKNRIGNDQGIKINKEIVYQELYNFDSDTINYLLESSVFVSKYFYKLMEYLFFVNIFVFSFKDGNVKLEKPNHRFFHQREYRPGLPVLVLFKHEDGSQAIYEIITYGDEYLFPSQYLENFKNYIEKHGYYISSLDFEDNYQVTKNYYSNINWNQILKNYMVVGQFINDSGRTFALNVEYKENKIMTIFIDSSYPLDCPRAHRVYSIEKTDCIKLFGKDYTVGSEGLWYSLNDNIQAVFIPVEGIKEKDNFKCIPFITISKRSRGLNKFNKINTIKKNAKIIMQIIVYIWNLSKEEDLDSWFSYYIAKGDKKTINTICNNNILIDYRFPTGIKTPEEAIEYYSDFIPSIFGKEVIFLYEELEFSVYQYLENYINKTKGYPKLNNKAIVEIFSNESDFYSRLNNKLILGEENFDDWKNFLQSENRDFLNLDNNLNTKRRGFLYKNKQGNIFIIQNNLYNSLKASILTSKVWKRLKYNLGYNLTETNIWKYIKEDYRLLEALEISTEKIINLANSYSKFLDYKIDDFYEALDFLIKEKIEIELEEKDYNYITLNYMEYINKENLKYGDPYNLFSYENEAYAAMLNIA